MKKAAFFVICLLSQIACYGSTDLIITEILDKQAEMYENAEYEDLYEMLVNYADNPLNLNTASRSELEEFPLFNPVQVENIQEYLYDYGQMYSVYELLLVEGFDSETMRLCAPFLKAEIAEEKQKITFKNIFKYGKHNFTGSAATTLQKKRGYVENIYQGPPFGGYFKYKFNHKNLSYSLVCEQDAGEKFGKSGFDFYSAHVMLKNIGACKAFALGDYKVNFGQGLVLKSNVFFGRSNDPSMLIQRQDAISAYTSCSEYGYLRGAATTWAIKNVNISGFVSYTNYKDGQNYHRTLTELQHRNSEKRLSYGGNVNYRHRKFKIGASFVRDYSNKTFAAGLDYRTRLGKIELAGEVAMSEKKKFAVLQSANFTPNSMLSFSALLRYYDPDYENNFGNSYCERELNNEAGVLFAMGLKPAAHWSFSTYLDMFRFMKPVYGIYKPSDGFKFSFDVNYTKSENFSLYAKYRLTRKEAETNAGTVKNSIHYRKHNFKLSYYSKLFSILECDGGVTGTFYNYDGITSAWVLYNNLKINIPKPNFKIVAGISFFDVPYYQNRIYLYESGLPNTFSSVMYYGEGCRLYLVFGYNAPKYFSINLKASHVFYTDGRQSIGSGYEIIKGSCKTDLRIVATIKF